MMLHEALVWHLKIPLRRENPRPTGVVHHEPSCRDDDIEVVEEGPVEIGIIR